MACLDAPLVPHKCDGVLLYPPCALIVPNIQNLEISWTFCWVLSRGKMFGDFFESLGCCFITTLIAFNPLVTDIKINSKIL